MMQVFDLHHALSPKMDSNRLNIIGHKMKTSDKVRVEDVDEIGRLKDPSQIIQLAQQIILNGAANGYVYFVAGRACIDLGEYDKALTHLRECMRISPKQKWALYEICRAFLRKNDEVSAFEFVHGFMSERAEPLNQVHLDVLETILDVNFDKQPRSITSRLYYQLAQSGSNRYLTLLRALEGLTELGQTNDAEEILKRLGKPRDGWGHLIVARYYVLRADAAKVEEHSIEASAALDDDANLAIAVVEILKKIQRSESLAKLIERWKETLPIAAFNLICVIVPVDRRATLDLIVSALSSPCANRWHFIAYLYQVGENLSESRKQIYEALLEKFGNDGDLLMCFANIEVGRRNFEDAARYSRMGIDINVTQKSQQPFLFKLFEISCFRNDLHAAEEYLAKVDQSLLDTMQIAAIARYHAELGDWRGAYQYLVQLLTSNIEIRTDHAQLLIRTVRKIGNQEEVLKMATGFEHPLLPNQNHLITAIFEDWVIASKPTLDKVEKYLSALALKLSDLLQFKLLALDLDINHAITKRHEAMMEDGGRSPRRAVFFCADKSYVFPALVSLASLLENNFKFRSANFHLVINDELIPAVKAATEALSKYYGVSIQLQATSQLLDNEGSLGAGYGLFTGGHQLTAAAYYRIYMARRLAESGQYDQMLYVDSDTVVLSGYDDLFDQPYSESTLLMARLEVDRAEVREAIMQHGLEKGMYFNSGILWFPQITPELIGRLRAAEEAAEQRGKQLLFQDQCALNIGFAGAFSPLGERFNYFAGPADSEKLLNSCISDVSILHVLDRPKPWDSAYVQGSVIQQRWLSAAMSLKRVVGDEAIKPIMELMVQ